jgi:hypothetical protein
LKDLRAHTDWSAHQLRHGFFDQEDNCYRCTSCAYEVISGSCTKCGHEYFVKLVVDSKLIERLNTASFDVGSDGANSDGNAGYWDGTAWVVGTKPARKRKAIETKPIEPKAKRMRGSPPGIKDTVVRAQVSSSKAPARRRVAKKASVSAAPPADKMDEMYVVYINDIALVADSPIVHKHIVENRSHVHPSDPCVHAIDIATCSRCKGKNCAGHKTPWLLDSGASNHYTNNLDDYVDYTAWLRSEHRTLSTATSTTKIIGVGTVMIKVPDLNNGYQTVCIWDVRYVPDLTTRLLSLGTFLAEGMNVQGDDRRLILEHKGKPFMVFEPRGPRNTLFGVNSEKFSEDVATALKTIHNVDYDTMHCRFAHPSDEVLKHA